MIAVLEVSASYSRLLEMDTKPLKTGLGLAVAIATLALPQAALAQRVVPPGNSAATQYTEAFPTANGNTVRKHRAPTPANALGAGNARRLEAKGPEGREAASVAAETAPVPAPSASVPASPPGQPQTAHPTSSRPTSSHSESLPDGSSGLGRVVAEATGSSDSGDLGILLPLLILAAVLGSGAYFWRHRHRTA